MLLDEYMKKNELTQRHTADSFGITISHLRMILVGKASASKKLAILMEEVTNSEITKEEAIFYKEYKEANHD